MKKLDVVQMELWHEDSPDRPWTVTREELWLLLDSKAHQSRCFNFRNYDDAKRSVVNVLNYRDKDGSNMYVDNASDYSLHRAGAIEYSEKVFNFVPDGNTVIEYSDVLEEIKNGHKASRNV